MQIVIDIPEGIYMHLLERYKYQNTDDIGLSELDKVGVSIKNGTPLPKHHGRLGDLDAVMDDICNSINEMTKIGFTVDGEYLWGKLNDAIDNAQTFIKADTESEE